MGSPSTPASRRADRPLRVVIAPDSFKGSIGAADAGQALAAGWRSVRPQDEVLVVPLADGGEGTLDALAACLPGSIRRGRPRAAADGPGLGPWLHLLDGTAVVELAAACGIGLFPSPAPLTASTVGLGLTIADALDHGARRVVVALGGSASTDGGAGALTALGARFEDEFSLPLPPGGAALDRLARVDVTALRPPPPGGVVALTDVRNPLLGPSGAAAVFAPQKGASPDDLRALEAGLAGFAAVVGRTTGAVLADQPGAGAAGGTAFGLSALWSARIQSGADYVIAVSGLLAALRTADVVITGEGRVDSTSFGGKIVGAVLAAAGRSAIPMRCIVAGSVDGDLSGLAIGHNAVWADSAGPHGNGRSLRVISLAELAGTAQGAMAQPARWLTSAGTELAALALT